MPKGDAGDDLLPFTNTLTNAIAPVKPPSVFEQAGTLQANAQTGGAAAEVGGINQAIEQLKALLGIGGSVGGLQQGASIGGFGDRLSQIINGDAFSGIVDERNRNVTNQLGSVGLSRSGANAEASRAIPTDLALGIESQLFGRQQGNAGLQTNIVQLIAQLLGQSGAVTGEGIRGAAEAEAGGILGEEGFQLQQQQQEDQNQSNLFSTLGGIGGFLAGGPVGGGIGSALGSVFSDPRLKENVRLEGKIGPLDLVRWDWIPEAQDTIVGQCKTIGFMSTQVKEHFPEFVSEFGGYDVIDYTSLMERLDG